MTDFKRRQTIIIVALLGILGMLGPIGHDVFIPAIPKIAGGLNTTTNLVSVSISAIFLGSAFGTLLHGPLADRFGRKPVILWVLGIYSLAATAAAFSSTVETLIICRFFQGIALSGGRVLSATVARDLFDKERLAKMMSDMMFVTSIAPVVAPIIGGFTAKYLPWQSSLVFMAIFGGLVFILFSTMFRESITSERLDALRPADLWRNIRITIENHAFQMHSLCGGFVLAGFVVFLSVSASILIQSYGVQPESYGFMFAAISGCYLTGTLIGGRLVTRLGLGRMVGWGILICLIGSGLMLVMAGIAIRTPIALTIPMGVYTFGLGFVNPNTVAGALQPFRKIAGSASSFTNFIRGIMGAAVSFGMTFFQHDDALVMASTIFLLGCAAAIVYRFGIQEN